MQGSRSTVFDAGVVPESGCACGTGACRSVGFGNLTASERKQLPIGTAVLDYFPLALAEIAKVSLAGQRQHGTIGWDRTKSTDESDALIRHYLDRGTFDSDGLRHSAKLAWRALALLQKECEAAVNPSPPL